MNRRQTILASIAILGAGVWVSDAIFQPVPMPLAGAAALGWLGFWILPVRRERWGCVIGWLVGGLLGAAAHARSHAVEGRVQSATDLARHVGLDLGAGLLVAAAILLLSLGWTASRQRPG
jgi:hypothetical protein